jgi:hypothetical protein
MSAGADWTPPMCARCGKRAGAVLNRLIGGFYCKPCDRYITCPSPDLEAQYNARVAARKRQATA